jgi:hypothetical protein
MSKPTKYAHQLNYDQLISLVEVFQYILWYDEDLGKWSKTKKRSMLQLDTIAHLMAKAGLRPK